MANGGLYDSPLPHILLFEYGSANQYSIDNYKSFNSLESWLNEIRTKGNPNVKLFLIGNKIDLKEKRKVTEEQAKKFHVDYGFDFFLETSAKTGFNTQKIFVEAARTLYEQNLNYQERISNVSRDSNQAIIGFSPQEPDNINFDEESTKKTKKCC